MVPVGGRSSEVSLVGGVANEAPREVPTLTRWLGARPLPEGHSSGDGARISTSIRGTGLPNDGRVRGSARKHVFKRAQAGGLGRGATLPTGLAPAMDDKNEVLEGTGSHSGPHQNRPVPGAVSAKSGS